MFPFESIRRVQFHYIALSIEVKTNAGLRAGTKADLPFPVPFQNGKPLIQFINQEVYCLR
jgi:hypothetical protein